MQRHLQLTFLQRIVIAIYNNLPSGFSFEPFFYSACSATNLNSPNLNYWISYLQVFTNTSANDLFQAVLSIWQHIKLIGNS